MQSSNPAIAVATRQAGAINFGGADLAATLSGTTSKAILYVLITLVVGYLSLAYTIGYVYQNGAVPSVLMYGSLILGVIVAFVTIFKPNLAPITGPIYAILEGAALGSLSGMFEFKYPGIAATAVLSTFVVVLTMLALWKFRIIVPTARFRSIMTGAISGIAVIYILDIVLRIFGIQFLPTSGPISIGISLIICTIAAFSLVLDNIEQSVNAGLPKYFESFNAFSLLVTICWLYVEILKLLSRRE